MAETSSWFISHYDELLGTIISIIYLYFSIRQSILLWPLGLISSAIYVYVFCKAGIYADMGLQMYYVIISIFGWYNWKKMQGHSKGPSPVRTVFKVRYLTFLLVLITGIMFVILSQLLIAFTNSNIPYLDAFITSLSITATWMLAKKHIEQWIVWIFVDSVSAAVYFYKGLYITIILYLIYAALAFLGYRLWKKDFKKEQIAFN
jgi:nicotinamide mononucleotide transporter